MRIASRALPGLSGDAVFGELVGGPSRRTTTFGAGRVCEEEGCTTRLSVYNGRTRCSLHDFDESLMNFRCQHHPARPASRPRHHAAARRAA